jgi:hypothetical protein
MHTNTGLMSSLAAKHARLSTFQAFSELSSTASSLLQLLFSDGAGDHALKVTAQQVQAWLGQPAAGPAAAASTSSSGTNSSSVLHVSSYRAAGGGSPAPLLGGSEAHIDRGLLTVIADTGPGLQVGVDKCLHWISGSRCSDFVCMGLR